MAGPPFTPGRAWRGRTIVVPRPAARWITSRFGWGGGLGAGELERTLCGHTNWVLSLGISADGRRLASGSWDKTVRVWDLATGAAVSVHHDQVSAIRSVALSADGTRFVSGFDGAAFRVWSMLVAKGAISK